MSDITGGEGDDVLIGDDHANRLLGGPGRDRVVGLGGNDDLAGEAVSAGAGDDEVIGGPGAVPPSCGPGRDLVLTAADSLVGEDCELVGACRRSAARPRLHLPDAGAPFLLDVPSCAPSCKSERWTARAHGRVVASAGPMPGNMTLDAQGQQLLRRERVLRVRVTHTFTTSAIEGGGSTPHTEAFRVVLRM